MNASDTGCKTVPSRTAVGVGSISRIGVPVPALPQGYELIPVPAVEDLRSVMPSIVLVDTGLENTGEIFQQVRDILGDGCVVVACAAGELAPSDCIRWIDCGADDVANALDEAMFLLVLKRAEQTLRRIEELRCRQQQLANERNNLQSAVDHLPSPIFFKDREGIYSGCNKAFEDYIGLSADEIIGRSVYDVSPSKYAAVYHAADVVLMRNGGIQIYDAEVRYANGETRNVTFHKAVMHDMVTGEVTGLAGAMLDITDRKRLEASLTEAAEKDYLTGAYNRRKFFERAEEMEQHREGEKSDLAILVMDVDYFKRINDRFGHACGDLALRHLVSILEELLPEPHVFARAGGEEFFAVLVGCNVQEATELAEKIRSTVADQSFPCEGYQLTFSISIGLAMARADESIGQTVLRADQALYRAKDAGRNRVIRA